MEIVEPARNTGSRIAYGVLAPRTADVHVDFEQLRMRLLRGELERGGPPRKLRGRSEAIAEGEIVDLDDHAISVEVQAPASVGPLLTEGHRRIDVFAPGPMRFDRCAEIAHPLEHFGVRILRLKAEATGYGLFSSP